MATLPGWGTVAGFIAKWLDKLIPSKKSDFVDKFHELNKKYEEALNKGDDTNAAIYRKQMEELRKKASYTDGDM